MTDGEGFVRSLREHGISVAGKKLVIAGSGGAATAIQVQCALDGARELVIFNRTAEKARRTAERICSEISECTIRVCELADQRLLAEEMRTADILVNGTSVGMAPETDKSVVEDAKGPPAGTCCGRYCISSERDEIAASVCGGLCLYRRDGDAAVAGSGCIFTLYGGGNAGRGR